MGYPYSPGDVLTAADLNADLEQYGAIWTAYTPVFTNFTLGNGSVNARYCQINDIVFVEMIVTLGSTSSLTSFWRFGHPVGSATGDYVVSVGTARMFESGASTYYGTFFVEQSFVTPYYYSIVSSKVSALVVNTTVPFTWGTGDIMRCTYYYRKV